ncbi:hypothetical protein ACWF99_06260 [Nocardia sp. NPDC055002]
MCRTEPTDRLRHFQIDRARRRQGVEDGGHRCQRSGSQSAVRDSRLTPEAGQLVDHTIGESCGQLFDIAHQLLTPLLGEIGRDSQPWIGELFAACVVGHRLPQLPRAVRVQGCRCSNRIGVSIYWSIANGVVSVQKKAL